MEILSSVEWNKQLLLSDLMSGDTAGEREPHALIDEDSFGESNGRPIGRGGRGHVVYHLHFRQSRLTASSIVTHVQAMSNMAH